MVFQGFNGIRTRSLCVSAAVLYQLNYEDPYTRGRPIYRVHQPVKGMKHRMKLCELGEYSQLSLKRTSSEIEKKCPLVELSAYESYSHMQTPNKNGVDITCGRVKEAVNPKFRKKVDHPSNFKRRLQRKFIILHF